MYRISSVAIFDFQLNLISSWRELFLYVKELRATTYVSIICMFLQPEGILDYSVYVRMFLLRVKDAKLPHSFEVFVFMSIENCFKCVLV